MISAPEGGFHLSDSALSSGKNLPKQWWIPDCLWPRSISCERDARFSLPPPARTPRLGSIQPGTLIKDLWIKPKEAEEPCFWAKTGLNTQPDRELAGRKTTHVP